MREGTLRRSVASRFAGALLLVAAAACTTPLGGLLVTMEIEPGFEEHDRPSRFTMNLSSSPDGGTTYANEKYIIDDASDEATPAGQMHFPASFFIESNGDPDAAVAIRLDLSNQSGSVERVEYWVTQIPTSSIAVLPVAFGSACGPGGPTDGVTSCPCLWEGGYWMCVGSSLSQIVEDSGWPPQGSPLLDAGRDTALDAGPDTTLDAGPNATLDTGLREATDTGAGDSTVRDAAALDASAGDAANEDADTGAEADATQTSDAGADQDSNEDAPLALPCDAPCAPGQQCVDGTCVPAPPSCSGGGPGAGLNCGVSGTDDCCASDEVRGGSFFRDFDGHNYIYQDDPATVSQLRVDRYEVTVGRFRAFVNAVSAPGDASPNWTPAPGSGKHAYLNDGGGLSNGGDAGALYEPGWDPSWDSFLPQTQSDWNAELVACTWDAGPLDTWTPSVGSDENEKRPIGCINWYEAYAFCIWDNAFLPSQAEWDYTAAGGEAQNVYAWGNTVPGPNAELAIYGCYYPPRAFGNDCQGLANVAPVGSAPAGAGVWGQLDLTGNVLEWTLDTGEALPPVPCVDCAVTSPGPEHGFRGGAFDSNVFQLFNSFTLNSDSNTLHGDVGVRCARAP